ncbi:hypothetical protein [Nitratiruptor sp. SB155-2]|uniref:hypothetical protein n=1 Tax=Nitratiruptor sp. (strain SB155-2) TaxID=387092 RepID=UPI00015870AA|nr:hypothetical protein [Nitratiruptor sp. SB155-2]BAF70280.1 conserved hypothetical protein [Nitratiruptor sp. SB155-2]
MKKLVEKLKNRELFQQLRQVDLVSLGIKKRWELFEGVNEKKEYILVLRIARKSRFLVKDAQELESVSALVAKELGHNFKKRYLLLQAPLCSKAAEYLKKRGWKIDASL